MRLYKLSVLTLARSVALTRQDPKTLTILKIPVLQPGQGFAILTDKADIAQLGELVSRVDIKEVLARLREHPSLK